MTARDEIKAALHSSKSEVLARGHAWDVADVMAILDEHEFFETEQ